MRRTHQIFDARCPACQRTTRVAVQLSACGRRQLGADRPIAQQCYACRRRQLSAHQWMLLSAVWRAWWRAAGASEAELPNDLHE